MGRSFAGQERVPRGAWSSSRSSRVLVWPSGCRSKRNARARIRGLGEGSMASGVKRRRRLCRGRVAEGRVGEWKNTRRGSRGCLSRGGLLINGVARKAGGRWVERGSSPDYFICRCRNNIKGQGCPGVLRGAAGPGAEVQLRLETRKQPTTQTWRDNRATGKIRIVCDAVVSALFVGCCRFDGRSPPNVMSQSSHGERMAG